MSFDQGEVKVINPQKEIAKEIVFDVVMRHRDAIKQARTGERLNEDTSKLTDREKRMNQVKALALVISSQREMITISRPIIFNNCEKQWKKKYPEDKRMENYRTKRLSRDYEFYFQ